RRVRLWSCVFAFYSPIIIAAASAANNGHRGDLRMVLTERQRRVLDYISGFLRENGYSPSFQEIADGVGLSSIATVHKHIATLERKGWLKRGHNQSRSLEPSSRYSQEF